MTGPLPLVTAAEAVRVRSPAVHRDILAEAGAIVEDVRRHGESAVRRHSERFGDLDHDDPIRLGPQRLAEAAREISGHRLDALQRMHERVDAFARAQLDCVGEMEIGLPGGRGGHRILPIRAVGAYAPGGRYPLPTTVIMTVSPARVAGSESVVVASPRAGDVTRAAAWVAGADSLLNVGGAQAVAALAFGVFDDPVDIVVGPGNEWVTAAKKYLYGEVGIDGLAGPSEIVIIADDSADPGTVAADLLAQAEHDSRAMPVLVSIGDQLVPRVQSQLIEQLSTLTTAGVAAEALGTGFCVVAADSNEAAQICNVLAPEHVAIHSEDPDAVARMLTSYGSLFIGDSSAEVFADYGVGPNHVLPTGGSARYTAGLSVFSFLRFPTWTVIEEPDMLVADTARLARIEGLEAHARAAERR